LPEYGPFSDTVFANENDWALHLCSQTDYQVVGDGTFDGGEVFNPRKEPKLGQNEVVVRVGHCQIFEEKEGNLSFEEKKRRACVDRDREVGCVAGEKSSMKLWSKKDLRSNM
jgi:hypothetical protein